MTTTVSGSQITFNDNSTQNTAASGFGFKNRIINGAMVIDQRNAGASVTPTNGVYTLDRWQAYQSSAGKFSVQQNAASVTPPTGFTNYLGVTSLAATTVGASNYYWINQSIEGYNVSDLDCGKSTAKTFTLSFWVRSSLTGTFGIGLQNSAGNRSYVTTYTISSANTWEQKTITVTGDTTGTWLTTNGIGLFVSFSLGIGSNYTSSTTNSWIAGNYVSPTGATSVVGTNGATFYITGVQLEKGSTATSFDYRPYGQELALCQRYLPVIQNNTGERLIGPALSTTRCQATYYFQVTPRVAPTGITATTASNFGIYIPATAGQPTPTAIAFAAAGIITGTVNVDVSSGFTAGQFVQFFPNNSSAQIQFTGCEL